MDKRNRLWRRKQLYRVFNARLRYCAATSYFPVKQEDGTMTDRPTWRELAKERCCFNYKTMSTPCSCWICRGESYNRRANAKETRRIICESFDAMD